MDIVRPIREWVTAWIVGYFFSVSTAISSGSSNSSSRTGSTTRRSAGCMPSDKGWRYDVGERGNGNQGHRYGTELSGDLKTALVEYLKTF